MEHLKSNLFSHLTAKKREFLSSPAKYLYKNKLLKGDVLDYGCGLGTDVKILKEKMVSITGFDKYYFPVYPIKKFDTIICIYVLNVLLMEEQTGVLMDLSQLLKPTGKAYFAVRRDIKYEGFRIHKLHGKPTYQCQVKLNYKSIFKNDSFEIYEYQHYNKIAKNSNLNCPFCNPESNRELIVESSSAYSIKDKYPVSKGHSLIIPKRHCRDYFELTTKEQFACWIVTNKTKIILDEELKPDGYNIGINVNNCAGQTISHVHIHLIPRYEGDCDNPIGGIRNVFPLKASYLGDND